MKLLIVTLALVATTLVQALSVDYLPPVGEYAGALSNSIETNFLDNEPAHTLTDDGYRYKTVKRYRLRQRRDVSELTNSYLPPTAASVQAPVYSIPAAETYEVEASEPAAAHSFGDDGYRYRAVKRYRLHRHRRDVSELSNNYLPPLAASSVAPVYTPAEETFEVQASEPAAAHSFSDDGYRYKAVKRYRLRHRV